MHIKSFIVTGLLAVTLAMPVNAQELSENSKAFVEKAAISNMFEIRSSELVLERVKRQDIRNFAQDMIDDHTKAGENLKLAISTANLNIQVPESLDEKHQEKMNDLQEADAENFEEKYIDIQVEAHEKAVSLFEDYAEDGENPELQQFAAKTLPTLRQHKERVERLEEDVEG